MCQAGSSLWNCPFVRSARPLLQVCCCGPGGQEINRLPNGQRADGQQQPHRSTARSSKCVERHAVSWRRKLNTNLFEVELFLCHSAITLARLTLINQLIYCAPTWRFSLQIISAVTPSTNDGLTRRLPPRSKSKCLNSEPESFQSPRQYSPAAPACRAVETCLFVGLFWGGGWLNGPSCMTTR